MWKVTGQWAWAAVGTMNRTPEEPRTLLMSAYRRLPAGLSVAP